MPSSFLCILNRVIRIMELGLERKEEYLNIALKIGRHKERCNQGPSYSVTIKEVNSSFLPYRQPE